jgi:hypothetical protein
MASLIVDSPSGDVCVCREFDDDARCVSLAINLSLSFG